VSETDRLHDEDELETNAPADHEDAGEVEERSVPPNALSLYERVRKLLRRDFLVGGVSPRYFITRWIFLRLLAIVHLIAFASLWVQIGGLIGSRGIAPAHMLLDLARNRTGVDRYWRLPSLCWLNDSDWFLHVLCGSGMLFALVLLLGYAPPLCLVMLYVLYLSLVSVSPDFLTFQWDTLLLETTFLAIFFAPLQWRPSLAKEQVHSRVMLLLLRWLLFRLTFASGVLKLKDVTWQNLTALDYHYETQPLPTVLGWYAHHLPEWFQRMSVGATLTIELVVPFLVLAPRRIRGMSSIILIGFQLLIMATGNFTFFNVLTIALCLLLLDDRHWKGLLPKRAVAWLGPPESIKPLPFYRKLVMGGIAIPIMIVTGSNIAQLLPNPSPPSAVVFEMLQRANPFYVANRYGLFAHMTTTRPEIVIEGRHESEEWKAYSFKYKPGNLDQPPRRVAPHQPRLDWQMWFAALRPQPPAWFLNLCYRMLEGEPEVLALLDENPFPDAPPKEVRALLYEYKMTDLQTKRDSGNWWSRELIGQYMPPMSLKQSAQVE
jgi:hypothetical protein